MKRLFYLLGFSSLILLGCTPDRDTDLDGKWQLREVFEADGSSHPVDTVWYNFQNTLFMYQLSRENEDGTLKYEHCYGYKYKKPNRTISIELDNRSFLHHTDWTDTERTFVIEKQKGTELILSSEGKRYRFHRF